MLDESRKNPRPHRKRRYWLAVAAAVPVLILAVPGIAQASTPAAGVLTPPNCPSATLCTYENVNFNMGGGTQWNFPYGRSPHLVWFFVGPNVNDKISSLWNNRAWISYAAKNCPTDNQIHAFVGGEQVQTLVGSTWPDGSSINNNISAVALGTSKNTQGLSHGSC